MYLYSLAEGKSKRGVIGEHLQAVIGHKSLVESVIAVGQYSLLVQMRHLPKLEAELSRNIQTR